MGPLFSCQKQTDTTYPKTSVSLKHTDVFLRICMDMCTVCSAHAWTLHFFTNYVATLNRAVDSRLKKNQNIQNNNNGNNSRRPWLVLVWDGETRNSMKEYKDMFIDHNFWREILRQLTKLNIMCMCQPPLFTAKTECSTYRDRSLLILLWKGERAMPNMEE